MLRRVIFTLLTLLLAAPVLAVSTPAIAATQAPEELTVSSTRPADIPTFSWQRVPEATDYTVEVASSSAFTTRLWSATTVNLNVVPTKQLPSGELWFRVRANASSGASEWSVAQFTRDQEAGPTLKTPANGAALDQPSDPVLLSWAPRAGVIEYEIEISPSAGFVDPALSKFYKTKTTSLVRPDPQPARPYYWRVRGILATGITTKWSDEWSYVLGSLPTAVLRSPVNNATVRNVVLDWEPVRGATSYDVELSLVPDFSTLIHSRTKVLGTRYSPPTTLDNDQYYWRVRARDVLDNPQDVPSDYYAVFTREWPDQPSLQYPLDGSTVGDPFYFQWTPVELASSYRLEVDGLGGAFLNPCRVETTQTTFTPTSVGSCLPTPGQSYKWRVIALDDPGNVQTDPVAATQRAKTFTYAPGLVTPLSPANGARVETPTVTWEPKAGAAAYKVVLTNTRTGATTTATSYTTSFTPGSKLSLDTYRWSVSSVSDDGREGQVLEFASQPTFTLVASTATAGDSPEPLTPPATYGRFPTLQWSPVTNATKYQIDLSTNGGSTFTTVTSTFAYAEGQDISSAGVLPADTYSWRVRAFNGSVWLATGAWRTFTIAPRAAVTGKRIAMLGTEVGETGTSCSVPSPGTCENISHTPVMRWDDEADTGGYLLYLSYDRELTHLVGKNGEFPIRYPVVVNNTAYTPPASLPDSEAGTPYYWTVRPCVTLQPPAGCRDAEYPTSAFSKLSAKVRPTSGGVPLGSSLDLPKLEDDITLSWEDYLGTNTAAPAPGNGLVSPSRTEARQYRVQVSTDPQFATLLDNLVVDQTTFTSFGNTYPEGQVYWRVQAIDGTLNPLPWSNTWTFMKKSDVPTLIGPSGDATPSYDGSTPLRWDALDYASAYDVEIYRNNDTKPDATNLVDEGTIAQTAVSWIDPVAPSPQAYTWRVRRVDAKGRRGDWSAWMSYVVKAQPVDLQSPAPAVDVAPRESLFSWAVVAGAKEYRWERRAPGAGTTAATVTTPATSYAPTAKLPEGDWEWRVVALDTGGQQLGVSPWRSFSVTVAPQVVTAPTISGTGQVGSVLTSTAPQWSMQNVTNYYQWLRRGFPIAGATSSSYELTGTDVGQSISLRITGRRPGYDDTVTTSNAIAATAGPAPSTSSAATISGAGKVGTVLIGTAPTWNEPGVTMSFQWLRGSSTISGATSLDYTVQAADVDKDLSLRVVGRKSGYADAVVTSNVIKGVAGAAPVNQTPPTVNGTPSVGQVLTSTPGSWDTIGLSYGYQWLRAGAPIPGATSASYRLQAADAGRSVSVKVIAKRTGYADGTATSDSLSVGKVASTTSASLQSTPIRRRARAKVSVFVSALGFSTPLGKVTVRKGTKTLASGKLTTSKYGRVTVTLPRLPKGRHKLKVKYAGNEQLLGSTSKAMTLTVTR